MTLRHADDITLMVESKEELKSLLMKVKEESEKLVLNVSYILFLSGDLKIKIKSGCWAVASSTAPPWHPAQMQAHIFLGRRS